MTHIENTPEYQWQPISLETRTKIARLGGALRNAIEVTGDVGVVVADAAGTTIRKIVQIGVSGVRGLLGAKPSSTNIPHRDASPDHP